MSTATVTSKGQITIPHDIRKALDLETGDQVIFLVEDGHAFMQPAHRRGIARVFGIFKGGRPYPGREIEREAARQEAARNALGLGKQPLSDNAAD